MGVHLLELLDHDIPPIHAGLGDRRTGLGTVMGSLGVTAAEPGGSRRIPDLGRSKPLCVERPSEVGQVRHRGETGVNAVVRIRALNASELSNRFVRCRFEALDRYFRYHNKAIARQLLAQLQHKFY